MVPDLATIINLLYQQCPSLALHSNSEAQIKSYIEEYLGFAFQKYWEQSFYLQHAGIDGFAQRRRYFRQPSAPFGTRIWCRCHRALRGATTCGHARSRYHHAEHLKSYINQSQIHGIANENVPLYLKSKFPQRTVESENWLPSSWYCAAMWCTQCSRRTSSEATYNGYCPCRRNILAIARWPTLTTLSYN